MIILSDSEDYPWCCCEEEQAQAHVVIALPTPSRRFEGAATSFPRRLYDFFTVEELSRLVAPSVGAAPLAQATYMHGWYVRARQAHLRARAVAYARPRRSPHIAQRDLKVSFTVTCL